MNLAATSKASIQPRPSQGQLGVGVAVVLALNLPASEFANSCFPGLMTSSPSAPLVGLSGADTPPGLRLIANRSPVDAEGVMRLVVVSADLAPLTSDRAARIAVLQATQLAALPTGWTEVAARRTLAEGALSFEPSASTSSDRTVFYVAQEALPPPPTRIATAQELRAALATAEPGARLHLAPGTYPGGFQFTGIRGRQGSPIVIQAADPQDPPVIQGGANGMQFSDAEWLELDGLVFAGATGNGLNIDDGGSFDSPTRQIVLRNLHIRDVGPTGNHDGIKLSGVVGFRVEGCTLERWGTGGSGIDMVGCHEGVIEDNVFRHGPAAASGGGNGVQAKGGTREVVIRRNRFEHAGARSVNLGGSTGLPFFRPPLTPEGEHWEAKDLTVEGNTFIGSTAPVAFVGVDTAVVRFNTIYRPERWAIRILQENTAAGFVPCRKGVFADNLIAFHSTQWSAGGVNIGANTAPETFEFARNWWYCLDNPPRSRPTLPVSEQAGTYGRSPEFQDAEQGDLRLRPDSPARGVGAEALPN